MKYSLLLESPLESQEGGESLLWDVSEEAQHFDGHVLYLRPSNEWKGLSLCELVLHVAMLTRVSEEEHANENITHYRFLVLVLVPENLQFSLKKQ